ncbi:cysteine rich repeat-containing protein [Mesorhizobium atlanticum]
MKTIIAYAICSMMLLTAAAAQTGPVATQCKDDIAKFCANETHDGGIRACLETNHDKVSAACQRALETTGGGMAKKKKS